jgi:hypothetical protein
MVKTRGILMNGSDVDASYGNKKFLISVLSALDELRVDDFVQLYLKAQDPAVYKFSSKAGDVHTHLLSEIACNSRLCPIEKERGAIILQAIYAAPAIANTTKAMAMLMVGATLEYDDFKSRFGAGGDLEPKALDPQAYSIWNVLHHALNTGIKQSDDVRFVIDKARIGETLYKDHQGNKHNHAPFLFSGGFNFDQGSFEQFLDIVPENQKSEILKYAPKGFYASDYFAAMVDNGFIPNWLVRHGVVSELYQAGCVEVFEKLLPHIFVVQSIRAIGQSSDLRDLLSSEPGVEITTSQKQMKQSYKDALNNFTSSLLKSPENSSRYDLLDFVKMTLVNHLIADNLDDFDLVVKQAVEAYPVGSSRDGLSDLYDHVFMYVRHMLDDGVITKNMKAMLTLIKDTMIGRMNEAVDLVNQLPESTVGRRKKDDRKFQGIGPEFARSFSHEPGHCR